VLLCLAGFEEVTDVEEEDNDNEGSNNEENSEEVGEIVELSL